MSVWLYLFAIVFIIVSILLILIVLLQKGRGGGLGAALGGAGSSAFGTKTGDVMTWVTIVLTALFLLLAVGAAFVFKPSAGTIETPSAFISNSPVSSGKIEVAGQTEITLQCNTPGSELRYTLVDTADDDGSAPHDKSKQAGSRVGVLQIKPGKTLKVRAFRKNFTPSATVTYTFVPKALPTAMPEISPDPGEIKVPTEITITCKTQDAEIRYTVDGSEPTNADSEKSKLYSKPFTVKPGTIVKAQAFANDLEPSAVALAEYMVKKVVKVVDQPRIAPEGGVIVKQEKVSITSTTVGATVYYTLDGSEPTEEDGTEYTKEFDVAPGTVVKARAFLFPSKPSEITTAEFKEKVLDKQAAKPTIKPAPGEIKKSTVVKITCSTSGAKIFYTVDGTEPTEKSTPYPGPFAVEPGTVLRAKAFAPDHKPSEELKVEYKKAKPAAPAPDPAPAPTDPAPVDRTSIDYKLPNVA